MPYTVTATADVANGRVKVDAQGGVPGETLYLFRRDSGGVAVVRDTSGGDVVWPATTALINVVRNPAVRTALADWAHNAGTGGTAATTRPTGQALPVVPGNAATGPVARVTWSVATTAVAGGLDADTGPGALPGTATPQMAAMWVRSSIQQRLQLIVQYRDAANASLGSLGGTAVVVPANTWTLISVAYTPPAGTVRAVLSPRAVVGTGGVVWPVGATLDGVYAMLYEGTVLRNYFDGATTDTAAESYAWTGTADASTSTATAYPVLTVYDNEARQGLATDYILADTNGVQLAVYRIDVPLWGTWLKSPGRPYLNTRCIFGSEAPVVRKARRASIDIEGAAQPIVLSEARSSRGGALTLAALTLAQAQAIDRLLDDGTTLMLDTPPSWGVAFRYISVGDSTASRGLSDGQLGLERTERVFSLADVLHVDAPIGVTVVDPGRTYATLPTLYGNYAALAAINPDYLALALGSAD